MNTEYEDLRASDYLYTENTIGHFFWQYCSLALRINKIGPDHNVHKKVIFNRNADNI